MKRIQESVTGKILSVALLLFMVFTGAVYGVKAVQALPFVGLESYQDSNVFRMQLSGQLQDVARAFSLAEELKQPDLDYLTRRQMQDELEELNEQFDRANSHLRGVVRDERGNVIESPLANAAPLPAPVYYASFRLGEQYVRMEWDSSYAESVAQPQTSVNGESRPIYTIECAVMPEEQLRGGMAEDGFVRVCSWYHDVKDNFSCWVSIFAMSMAAALLWLGYILWSAGHKAGEEGIVLTWQENIFFDLYLLAVGGAGGLVFALGVLLVQKLGYTLDSYILYQDQYHQLHLLHVLGIAGACVAFAGLVTLILRTLVVRLKARGLARSTLLCRALMYCWQGLVWAWGAGKIFVRSLPFLWRVIVLFCVYFFADLALFTQGRYDGWAGLLWFALNLAVLLILCWWAMGMQRLRRGCRAIAGGDLEHQIDTGRMPLDLKHQAEDLNNISSGLQQAVDQQMKSERFKAELITNVSHDLKTPLTSIINYVDLLKTTDQTDPKAEEYIEVLDRKAQRLKKLTEDLVEASKASTGTLNVVREKLGMNQLIGQALGEYEEKLEGRNLSVITSLPEEETYVYADGRHMWRVLDNLLSNCCKYAMEGTRVYLELQRGKGQVVLSVKNISREPLNVPAERLMERFVRGEEARSTEGSGLGLSIARSLTELQGGSFDLAVDGDLFKAVVTMPQAG